MSSVRNDRSEPIRGGVVVNISSTDHVFTAAQPVRAIWVGGAGDLKVITIGGSTITFVGVPTGTLLPVHVGTVVRTGTTSTNMLGLW